MEIRNGSNIRIFVEDDYDSMSKKAAEIISAEINAKPEGTFGFATGGTPVGTYKELIDMHKKGSLDFSKITTFNLDEYYPIKRDNDQSYYYFMYDNLFNHVNIDKSRVNLPNGEAPDWEQEVKEYEEKIVKAGGIDLQILGIGGNGHIAFNEPADVFSGYTTVVSIADETVKANARFFENEADVPRKAISMGIRSIMMAKKIVLVANGKGKADVIKKAIFGSCTPNIPASILQFHQDVTFVLDKEAYGE